MLLCKIRDIMKNINEVINYVKDVIGIDIAIKPINKYAFRLPVYITEIYKLYSAKIDGKDTILIQQNGIDKIAISQFQKQIAQLQKLVDKPVIVLFNKLEAYNRKRLIQKKIAFIVPYKQMYIPWLYIDFRDYGITNKTKVETLNPIAQQLLLLYILDKNEKTNLTNLTFKEIAKLLETSAMSITRAVDNLKNHGLVKVEGTKEKKIVFSFDRLETWNYSLSKNLFIEPVTKRVYVDEIPEEIKLLHSFDSALEEYTDMNPPMVEYFAMDKSTYTYLKKENLLINENEYESNYCLEIWKYNPSNIIRIINKYVDAVDPLSLYLCYLQNNDERIEMAKEQLTGFIYG